jgi:GNAT superfamily N-acetyltransferase
VIPPPSSADKRLDHTHAALIVRDDGSQRSFRFLLIKWPDWGDHGEGEMPYEYFDRYFFDAWTIYARPTDLRAFRQRPAGESGRVRWSALDECDHKIYGFEVQTPESGERRGWAFVVEREGALQIEEIYVRPEFRRNGYGSWLADCVAKLGSEKRMPLQLWIGFNDCESESSNNFPALVATARRIGVHFRPVPVPWAAYFASNEGPGDSTPVAPPVVPPRPRMPRRELLALAVGLASAVSPLNSFVAAPSGAANESGVVVSQEGVAPDVGSEAWEKLTARRLELIHKRLRDESSLTSQEEAELQRLQKISASAIAKAFPAAALDSDEMNAISRVLDS